MTRTDVLGAAIQKAEAQGVRAHDLLLPLRACPHLPGESLPWYSFAPPSETRILANAWRRGWQRAAVRSSSSS